MMLGKRPRPPMRRTMSITEFTVDLSNVEAPAPLDPMTQQPTTTTNQTMMMGPDGVMVMNNNNNRRNNQHYYNPVAAAGGGGGGVDAGYDYRFMSTISPRNHRRNSGDFSDSAHFLRVCGLCNRRLASGRDIYMYKGDTAFCSLECRQQQIIQDERKEKCSSYVSNKDAPSTVGSESSSKTGTVAAA